MTLRLEQRNDDTWKQSVLQYHPRANHRWALANKLQAAERDARIGTQCGTGAALLPRGERAR